MSATDELRRMLDERGVEWYEPTMKPNTTWFPDAYGVNCRAKPWGYALCVKRYGLTPEQAIAATLGSGTLTAEQARKAIFDGSSYASYDGAKYYADGIGMQAIADELNSRAERMCEMRADGAHCMNGVEFYECRSCGEYACIPTMMGKSEPPNYCPNCGRKVKR